MSAPADSPRDPATRQSAPSSPAPSEVSWRLDSPPGPRWVVAPHDPEQARRFREAFGFPPVVARLLSARGFRSPEDVDAFLSPSLQRTHDPFLMADMEPAVERIGRALGSGERICVYGDYDVDGISATTILVRSFRFLGAEPRPYIPHRTREGYGLQTEAVRRLAAEGVKLIVTVDNGTTAVEPIEVARSLGVDVIVTDHHRPDEGHGMPRALAIVNPQRADCSYPFKDLCGAGIAFKLAHATFRRHAPDPATAKEFLKNLLDYVALGTVADVVPLRGENRCFVSYGLELLRSGRRPAFREMMDVARVEPSHLSAGNLGFTLAPRINAAGRTEHAGAALELLLSDDPARCRELALHLERCNDDRRAIEAAITEAAFARIDERSEASVIVVGGEGWHPGVIGIVASRILDRYHRPVIVLGLEGEWAKGSARSIRGFDVHAGLSACREHLAQFGGHTMAAGLKLRVGEIEAFRASIDAHGRRTIRPEDLAPRIGIDAVAEPEEITEESARTLQRMEPFGMGNPKPTLSISGLGLAESPRTINGRHLKLRLASSRSGGSFWAMGWGMAGREEDVRRAAGRLRLAATPVINTWGGTSRVELEIRELSAGEPRAASAN